MHLGHAWDTTMQDTITRMKRMQGYDVLWLPGMDHAGIATQAKVEAKLKEMGTNRYELGREKFLKKNLGNGKKNMQALSAHSGRSLDLD